MDPSPDHQINDPDEINLLDYWRVIVKRKFVIVALFFVSVIAAAIVSLLMTPIYQAKATLMPIESSQGRLSAALGSLQNIPFVSGAVGGLGGKTATDKLVAILKSRTLAEDVIKKMDLMKILFKKSWDEEKGKWKNGKPPSLQDLVQALQGMVKVTDDKKGLLSISVDSEDPKLAADIANEHASTLHIFLITNAISLAKRNRIFLEKQLAVTKADLQITEEKLKSFQTTKKIAAMDEQAKEAIKVLAELKAQVIAREVQLGVMREYTTKANPDVKRMEDELREVHSQLKRFETGGKNPHSDDSLGSVITLSEAASVGLDYARLKRDALIQQKVFELLTQQLEMAKIEEAKDDITFQVIDPAIAPEKRIKPKRTQNVMIAGVVSIFLGVFLVFFLEFLEKQKSRQRTP